MNYKSRFVHILLAGTLIIGAGFVPLSALSQSSRQKISINSNWNFFKGDPVNTKGLSYDVRPDVTDRNDNIVADTKPTEGVAVKSADTVLKKWILPSANEFIKDLPKHHQRPAGNPGASVSVVQTYGNVRKWEQLNLPQDGAIAALQ